MDVDGYKIVNVYKPPPTRLQACDLPVFPTPASMRATSTARMLTGAMEQQCRQRASGNLALLFNSKDPASFHSGRWNTGTNPDLAFAGVDPDSRLPDRRVLDKFPRSQHRPSLIIPPRLAVPVPSMPVKR